MDAEPVAGQMVEVLEEPRQHEAALLPALADEPTELALAQRYLKDTLRTWKPRPSMLRVLVERAKDRMATNREVAERAHISYRQMVRMRTDPTFRQVFDSVEATEETSVLLLLHYMPRAACRTLYEAFNGQEAHKATIQAAQAIIDAAERRSDPRRKSALPSLD
jgi:hypothetical protein